MLDAKLVINGQAFSAHYQILSVIARELPDGSVYAPLARALVTLGIPSIIQDFIEGHDDLLEIYASSLSAEVWDGIWENADLELRRLLAEQEIFRMNLTDSQAAQLIRINDPAILRSVASHAEDLYSYGHYAGQPIRISIKMADALLEFIARHPDESVRRSMAANTSAPARYRLCLGEKIKKELEIYPEDMENRGCQLANALTRFLLPGLV